LSKPLKKKKDCEVEVKEIGISSFGIIRYKELVLNLQFKNNHWHLLKLASILIFLIATLKPYIFNGFWADDCILSQSYNILKSVNGNYLDSAWNAAMTWTRSGRFYPIALIANGIYY
jgi:hypothetical protein